MENESRKATDILLELENKVNSLILMIKSQDLTIKVLSNKISMIIDGAKPNNSKIVDNLNEEVVKPNNLGLQIEESPVGIRRTARPETYKRPEIKPLNNDANKAEVIVPSIKPIEVNNSKAKQEKIIQNAVPTMQRIVDKNGKSIFLADVEIIDLSNGTTFHKTKTNGSGKWLASLPVGDYKVFIKKREGLNKEKIEVAQTIKIDGSTPTAEIPMMIVK